MVVPRAWPCLPLDVPPRRIRSQWPDVGEHGLRSRGRMRTAGPGVDGQIRAMGRCTGDRRPGCCASGRREREGGSGERRLWRAREAPFVGHDFQSTENW
jgi:hypothetical protein